jgi:hypothetical protein
MQEIVGELVRWLGYFGLRLVTIGGYSGGTDNDRLVEGASGLAFIALITYLVMGFAF